MDLRPKLVFLLASVVLLAAAGANSATWVASANLSPLLTVSPNTAVPNQTVVLLGTGFTPATTERGAAASGAHQITGLGGSVITVAGTLLKWPYLIYPINFDTVGNWATPITIPVTPEIVAGGPVSITVVDDQGLALTTQVGIGTPRISLEPASGSRNSVVSITGEGFPAANSATSANVQVSISYAGSRLGVVSPNASGEIDATVQVPETAAIPSSNIVQATIVGFSQNASAIHSVPDATITVSPTGGRPGSVITIFGKNFPASAIVSGTRAGNISVLNSPAPVTGDDGKFTSFFVVPLFFPGVQTITATAGGITAVSSFTVTEGPAVTQPTPTPQHSIGAAQAMETLTRGDNLIILWNFDDSTKRWTYFDPRPAFANTIKTMVTGRVYWLRLNRIQAAPLNGKAVFLVEGWNLVAW